MELRQKMGLRNLDEVDSMDVDPRDAFLKLDDDMIFDRKNFLYFDMHKEVGLVLNERNGMYEVMFCDGRYKAISSQSYNLRLATAEEMHQFIDESIDYRFMEFEEEFKDDC